MSIPRKVRITRPNDYRRNNLLVSLGYGRVPEAEHSLSGKDTVMNLKMLVEGGKI